MSTRIDAVEVAAPDVVAAWRGIEVGAFLSVRREVRRRAGARTAAAIASQLAAVGDALTAVVETLPDDAFAMAGGEGDWNVAQALGHTADARAGLALAAGLAANGRWPADAPSVVPGVPGPDDAPRDRLLRRIATSQRVIERAAAQVAGHELDPCPLDHPLVGRLRCGEWLLFAGVHDLMHLEQLEALEASLGPAAARGDRGPGTPAAARGDRGPGTPAPARGVAERTPPEDRIGSSAERPRR